MNDLDRLIKKAENIIKEQGCFLLLYDVVDSTKFAEKYGYKKLYKLLGGFHYAANRRFKKYILPKKISLERKLYKFRAIVGDSGGAYFSSPEVIKPIIELAEKMLPFKLRWGIARDGWDKKSFKKENMKIID